MEERRRRSHSPVPTIVHTLVSPMSTCQRAPDDADESLADPRRPEPAEPADGAEEEDEEDEGAEEPEAAVEAEEEDLVRPSLIWPHEFSC